MKQISSVLLLCVAACPTGHISAQHAKDSTLNRTVVVENQYNPEVMDAFKVNVLPKVEEPVVEKRGIDYASSVRPFTAWPFVPMESMEARQNQPLAAKGYFRAAYGNRNNLDLKGSYLWDLSEADQLGVMASLYGFSGKLDGYDTKSADWDARFFRTDASLDYRHRFEKLSLNVGGAFASQVFNYMPMFAESSSQHFSMGEGYVGIATPEGAEPVEFGVKTGFKMFNALHSLPLMCTLKETNYWLSAYMAGRIAENRQVRVNFTFNSLGYDEQMVGLYQPDYMQAVGNPFYEARGDRYLLHLGAVVAWQNRASSGFMAAPDVKLDIHFADTYTFFVHALGGPTLNTLRHLNEASPYWMRTTGDALVTTNTAVDGALGVKGSPFPGVSFSLYGGYKYVQDELFVNPVPFVKAAGQESDGLWTVPEREPEYKYAFLGQADAKAAYAGASLCYGYKDRFDLEVEGVYHAWKVDGEEKESLLYLKPAFRFDCSVRAKVYKELYAQARYRYESRTGKPTIGKADAVNSLALSAGYEFAKRLNVFVRFDNVLNQYYLTEAGYPVQGFSGMGGLSIRF